MTDRRKWLTAYRLLPSAYSLMHNVLLATILIPMAGALVAWLLASRGKAAVRCVRSLQPESRWRWPGIWSCNIGPTKD